jgi:hypothetical protein
MQVVDHEQAWVRYESAGDDLSPCCGPGHLQLTLYDGSVDRTQFNASFDFLINLTHASLSHLSSRSVLSRTAQELRASSLCDPWTADQALGGPAINHFGPQLLLVMSRFANGLFFDLFCFWGIRHLVLWEVTRDDSVLEPLDFGHGDLQRAMADQGISAGWRTHEGNLLPRMRDRQSSSDPKVRNPQAGLTRGMGWKDCHGLPALALILGSHAL